MPDVVVDLEPQADADASPDVPDRFKDDKSVDTAELPAGTVEVETETEEADEKPESAVESSPAEVEVLEEKAESVPVPDELQERIDKVTKSWRETERSVTALEQDNAKLRQQLSEVPVAAEPFKTLADFDFDEGKYQSYMASEFQGRATAAAEQAVRDAQSRTGADQAQSEFNVREKAFAKTVKDYDEVVHDRSLHISEPMARVIRANEDGPEMVYYLGSNPDVARRIAALPPEAVGFEMANIHHTLIAEKAKAAETKVTKAPPPVPKIKSGDAGMTKSPADMSDREFRKWREKQIANR